MIVECDDFQSHLFSRSIRCADKRSESRETRSVGFRGWKDVSAE